MNKRAKVLLIDDDDRLCALVTEYLENEGLSIARAGSGEAGLDILRRDSFDVIILDLMLPGIDGLAVCREIGTNGPPILMLTAKGDPMDRVLGLEMGAEDYLPKPFESRELLARLNVILRRGSRKNVGEVETYGRLELDRGSMEARLDGIHCDLSSHQFQLLSILASAAGRVLSRDHLMNAMQGTDLEAFDRSIDIQISRIRNVIEDDPKQPRRIITVRGTGYLFARRQD